MRLTVTIVAGAVVAGTLPLTVLPSLPDYRYDIAALSLGLLLIICRRPLALFAGLMLLASLWPLHNARTVQQQIMQLTQQPLNIRVQIENIQAGGERVRVRLIRADEWLRFPSLYAVLPLPKSPHDLCQGQRWQMTLRLRPLHAQLNEGGFDRQRFMLANHTPLTGKILAAELQQNRCSMRHQVMSAAQHNYQQHPWQSVISALTFGDRTQVNQDIMQLLRETGTAHLMAISGMHIGLAAGFGWYLTRMMQYFFPLRWINWRLPLYSSVLMAILYCWLSGANPPALRATLSVLIWITLRIKNINCSNWQVWLCCLAVILLVDPLSILSDSLWMSVIAVGGLLLWYHSFALPVRFRRQKRWLILRLLHLQMGILLLLMPLQIFIFHGISLSALVANIWAVPLVSLITVPLILCSLILNAVPLVNTFLWLLTDYSLALVFWFLQRLPHGWMAVGSREASSAFLCWLLLLCWRFGWWRSSPITVLVCALLLSQWRNLGPQAAWRVDMLDVGHGLAVVISRHGKAVLYDTGNRWSGGDMARSHIIPWLEWQGLHLTDVIISHEHLDHIGGLASIQRQYPQVRVRSAALQKTDLPCYQGVRWHWQKLTFTALWPPAGVTGSGNNQSCVISVTDGRWRVLLTGDIEKNTEYRLLTEQRAALTADLLQVPHHGSSSSSVPPFLRAVQPAVAVASVARYSAWRLPAGKVIARYNKNDIAWRDTALSGQISAQFFSDNWKVLAFREQIMPRWYHQWFGVFRDSR